MFKYYFLTCIEVCVVLLKFGFQILTLCWPWEWRIHKEYTLKPIYNEFEINWHYTEFICACIMPLWCTLLLTGKRLLKSWAAPTCVVWTWPHSLLQARSFNLWHSLYMCWWETQSQPAVCLWLCRCTLLFASLSHSSSPLPLRKCLRPASASVGSRYRDTLHILPNMFLACIS